MNKGLSAKRCMALPVPEISVINKAKEWVKCKISKYKEKLSFPTQLMGASDCASCPLTLAMCVCVNARRE